MRCFLAVVTLTFLTACDAMPARSGAALLTEINAKLDEGNLSAARQIADRYNPTGSNPSPYEQAAWCGRAAVQARLNVATKGAADKLVAARVPNHSAVATYALARDGFDTALRSVDEGLETLCDGVPTTPSATEYDAMRRPVAVEMKDILEPLRAKAAAGMTTDQLDARVGEVLAAERERSHEDMKRRCEELAARTEQPSYESSAVSRQADDAMKMACSFARTYGRLD